jgi:hypothetical protein
MLCMLLISIRIYRLVVPKLYESAISSQGIRGYINVITILKFSYMFK